MRQKKAKIDPQKRSEQAEGSWHFLNDRISALGYILVVQLFQEEYKPKVEMLCPIVYKTATEGAHDGEQDGR